MIAFDAASNSGYQSAQSTYSWSHTCAGSLRFLAVDVHILSVPGTTVTGVTHNGVAMTLIGVKSTVSGAGRVECWGLVAPATGSKTIAVTLSASVASAGTAASYTGVNQTTPTEAFNSAQATNVGAADANVTLTDSTDNCWYHVAAATDDTSVTAGLTSRNNVSGALGSGANEDSNAAVTPPGGGDVVGYTGVGALATWAIAGYALVPVGPTLNYSTVMSNFLANWPAWGVAGKSEGDRVAALGDGNDSSRDMSGTTGAIYRATAFNGHPGMEYDGLSANNTLASAGSLDSGLDTGDIYFAVVVKVMPWAGRDTTLGGIETVFSKSNFGAIKPIVLCSSPHTFGGDDDMHMYRVGGAGDPRATDGADGSAHIIEYVYDSGSGVEKLYIDGLLTYSTTRSAPGAAASDPFAFGQTAGGSLGHCIIGECALWAHSPNNTERQNVRTALATYYGITADESAPSAPTGFTATAAAQKVTLNWTAGTGAASHFVYRGSTRVSIVAMPTASFVDYTGDVGTAYNYTVAAHNTGGNTSTSALNRTATVPVFDTLNVVLSVKGDSISTDAILTIPEFKTRLEAAVPGRTVTYLNHAVNGQDSAGGAYLYTHASTSVLSEGGGQVEADRAAGVTHCMIFYGANDSKASENVLKADFKTNINSLVTACQKAGIVAVINKSYWSGLDNGVAITGSDFIPQYRDAEDELAAANPTWAKIGDTLAYGVFSADHSLYSDPPDYVHPNSTTGKDTLAQLWVDGFQSLFTDTTNPLVNNFTVGVTGLAWTMVMSEECVGVDDAIAAGDFRLSTGQALSGGATADGGVTWTGTCALVTALDAPTLRYFDADGYVVDTAETPNLLAEILAGTVTNNSTINVPGAPVLSVDGLEAGSTGILVSPTAPASDGGSAILAYEFWHKIESGSFVLIGTITAANLANHFLDRYVVTGLSVDIKVRCRNAIGYSAYSATRTVTSQGPDVLPSSGQTSLSIGISIGI